MTSPAAVNSSYRARAAAEGPAPLAQSPALASGDMRRLSAERQHVAGAHGLRRLVDPHAVDADLAGGDDARPPACASSRTGRTIATCRGAGVTGRGVRLVCIAGASSAALLAALGQLVAQRAESGKRRIGIDAAAARRRGRVHLGLAAVLVAALLAARTAIALPDCRGAAGRRCGLRSRLRSPPRSLPLRAPVVGALVRGARARAPPRPVRQLRSALQPRRRPSGWRGAGGRTICCRAARLRWPRSRTALAARMPPRPPDFLVFDFRRLAAAGSRRAAAPVAVSAATRGSAAGPARPAPVALAAATGSAAAVAAPASGGRSGFRRSFAGRCGRRLCLRGSAPASALTGRRSRRKPSALSTPPSSSGEQPSIDIISGVDREAAVARSRPWAAVAPSAFGAPGQAAGGSGRRAARACRGAPRAGRTRGSRRRDRTPPGIAGSGANGGQAGARRLGQRIERQAVGAGVLQRPQRQRSARPPPASAGSGSRC